MESKTRDAVEPLVALSLDEAFRIAFTLHRDGHSGEAEALYRRLLDVSPDHIDSLHFLGVLCHQGGRNREAGALISRILDLQPSNADAHSNLGNVLQEQGLHADAEASYRNAIDRNPQHAAAWNNLAVVLSAQGRFPEALDAARKAVALAPADADRRYNLANALRRAGQVRDATEAYQQALALEPGHANARHGLVRAYLLEGRRDDAVETLREWQRTEPESPTAGHLLAALTGRDVPARASDAYVRTLFDELAGTFDFHLSRLDYRAPALVAEAIARELPAACASLDVLDAGCGTGLCGALLRPYAKTLVGVDLSAGMLQHANARELYDGLFQQELGAFLGAQSPASFDLIASADTLCYFGSLEEIFGAFYRALRPGGLLVFTLEDGGQQPKGEAFRLGAHGRYGHDRGYALRTLEACGFRRCSAVPCSLRLEAGDPVAGTVLTARRPADQPA